VISEGGAGSSCWTLASLGEEEGFFSAAVLATSMVSESTCQSVEWLDFSGFQLISVDLSLFFQ
jgi:hypothetical protein